MNVLFVFCTHSHIFFFFLFFACLLCHILLASSDLNFLWSNSLTEKKKRLKTYNNKTKPSANEKNSFENIFLQYFTKYGFVVVVVVVVTATCPTLFYYFLDLTICSLLGAHSEVIDNVLHNWYLLKLFNLVSVTISTENKHNKSMGMTFF